MRICVVGAGAIGGMLGVKLAIAGHEVTLVARGAHLEAIRRRGLRLVMSDGTVHVAEGVAATAEIRTCGAQDLVILGVKAHQLPPIVDDLRTLFHDDTLVLPTQNGIPWWYFQGLEGRWEGRVLHSVDPGGRLSEGIEERRVIGCVVYPAAEIESPGVIRHIEGLRFSVGELDGSRSERIQAMADMLVASRPEVLSSLMTFAPRSGSRRGEICPSTRSAPLPTPPSRISAASPLRASLPQP